jgi:hypothetical protein
MQNIWKHPIRFWHWSAKWQFPVLLSAGALGVLRVSEYALSIFFLFLSALAAVSRLFHWDGSGAPPKWKLPLKWFGTIVIFTSLALCIYIVIAEKADKDWSHLQKPLISLLSKNIQAPRPFVPTPENWAAKQHIDTQFPVPKPPYHAPGPAAPPTLESECAAIGIVCGVGLRPPRNFMFTIRAIKKLESPVKFRVECDSPCRPVGTSAFIYNGLDNTTAQVTLESFGETTYINVLLPPNMLFETGMNFQFGVVCLANSRCMVTSIERLH